MPGLTASTSPQPTPPPAPIPSMDDLADLLDAAGLEDFTPGEIGDTQFEVGFTVVHYYREYKRTVFKCELCSKLLSRCGPHQCTNRHVELALRKISSLTGGTGWPTQGQSSTMAP